MKTLAERNKKTKNSGLPFRGEEKSPLFLSAKASGSPINFSGNLKTCSVKGCGKQEKYLILGYCKKHYGRFWRHGNTNLADRFLHLLTCKVKDCKKKYYGKGYCYKHWRSIIYYPNHKKEQALSWHKYYLKINNGLSRRKCKAENCKYSALRPYQYCFKHRRRIARNLPLDLSINGCKLHAPRGNRNFMWKGGVAEYPNHYLMKKQRLIILKNNPKCEYCGKTATEVHHKDENKVNHKLSNLAAACRKCNAKQSSKFYKKYGYTLDEIVKILGKSRTYWFRHQEQIDYYLLDKN